MTRYWRNFIAGEWREGAGDPAAEIRDPATEEVLHALPTPSGDEIEESVGSADAAFRQWRRVGPAERSRLLDRAASLLIDRKDAVAWRLVSETGKPLAQAVGEVESGAAYLRWFAEEARRLDGYAPPSRHPGERLLVTHEPLGVVAAFPAWNFPVALACRKLGPALAAGCSVVLKPAPEGSGAVVDLVECFVDAGAPAGLVNLLLGSPAAISGPLLKNPLVRKLSFTGSTSVGAMLMAEAAATVKRCSLELGGHAAVIVMDDVDAHAIGEASARRKFANAGQICVSPGRFFIHRDVARAFIDGFLSVSRDLRLGSGFEPDVDIGPMINARRLAATEDLIDRCRDDGDLLLGGTRSARHAKGYFFQPTVMTDVRPDSMLMKEEIFAPIAPIRLFTDLEDAIAEANSLEYGLAAFVFTRNLRDAHTAAASLEAGMVGVNTFFVGMPEAPYGGAKQSGYGTEGGRFALMDYTHPKLSVINLLD